MTLTKSQRTALDGLKTARPFHVVPAREIRARHSRALVTIPAHVETGLNTTTLYNLQKLGLITCSHLWLRGHTMPDLAITAAGEQA